MDFSYYSLGTVKAGAEIRVTLGCAANVCLMTPGDFHNYKNGNSYNYYGGYATVSPCSIFVPYTGTWYLTIDLGGYGGTVSFSVQIFEQGCESRTYRNTSTKDVDDLRWDIQEDNPDCIVKVSSDWCKKHPEWGEPMKPRTDFLVFDKKSGMLHKHYAIGEFNDWVLEELHGWR